MSNFWVVAFSSTPNSDSNYMPNSCQSTACCLSFPKAICNRLFDKASVVAIWELKHWRNPEALVTVTRSFEKKSIIQIQCDECKSIPRALYNFSKFLMHQFPYSQRKQGLTCLLITTSEIGYDHVLSALRGKVLKNTKQCQCLQCPDKGL